MLGKGKKRFEVVYDEGVIINCKIIVDKETGVHYLFSQNGYAGGLTPLLDSDGKTLIIKPDKE